MENAYLTAHTIAVLQTQRDEIDARIQELKDEFRDTETQVYVDESNSGGPSIIVRVSPNKRIDDKLAREFLDEEVYNTVSKQSIDTAKARAFLTAEGIEQITKVYDNKVTVEVQ